MKYYRFRYEKKIRYGILKGDSLQLISGSPFKRFTALPTLIPIGEVALLPPVKPSKIVAVGRNYRDHAAERNKPVPKEPLLFLKPSSAVIGPHDAILLPEMSQRVDYEGELALVLKKEGLPSVGGRRCR